MQPHDKNNFLIELTPTQLDSLKNAYAYADDDGYEVLHYSPYWNYKKPSKQPKEVKSMSNEEDFSAICEICGQPLPEGEQMFRYHGYSGDCPTEEQPNDPA